MDFSSLSLSNPPLCIDLTSTSSRRGSMPDMLKISTDENDTSIQQSMELTRIPSLSNALDSITPSSSAATSTSQGSQSSVTAPLASHSSQSASATISTPQDGTFSKFPDLPVEIQRTVYRHVVRAGRMIRIIVRYRQSEDGRTEESVEAIRDVPPLLHVCQDSRNEIFNMYTIGLGDLLRQPVYISYNYDTLFFGGAASIYDGSGTFGCFITANEKATSLDNEAEISEEAQLVALKRELRYLTIGGPTASLDIFQWLQMFYKLDKLRLPWTPDPNVSVHKQGHYNWRLMARLKSVWERRLVWEAKEQADGGLADEEDHDSHNGEGSEEEEDHEFDFLLDEDARAYFGGRWSIEEEAEVSEVVTTVVNFYDEDSDEDVEIEDSEESGDDEENYEGEMIEEADKVEDYY